MKKTTVSAVCRRRHRRRLIKITFTRIIGLDYALGLEVLSFFYLLQLRYGKLPKKFVPPKGLSHISSEIHETGSVQLLVWYRDNDGSKGFPNKGDMF